MELKLNKMNKALFRDRAKKLMLTGVLAGVIAGVAITSGISSITLKKRKEAGNQQCKITGADKEERRTAGRVRKRRSNRKYCRVAGK